MRTVYGLAAIVGLLLIVWTELVVPGTAMSGPEARRIRTVTTGPYAVLTHPGYVGTWLMITGCAGLAAGIWNVVAVGSLTELLLREWANREG